MNGDNARKRCVLDEQKACVNCGECNMCDLDSQKVCDNCMKCVNLSGADFRAIRIDDILLEGDEASRSQFETRDEVET